MATSILGERVHILRRRAGLTQNELGVAVGLSGNTISRLEKGAIQELRTQSLSRLADVLKTSADFLLGREDNPCGSPSVGIES